PPKEHVLMTRSILCGLFGLISVVTIGILPVACQSGGVGDPCTPEDEYDSQFAGFKVTEENIESRSFQCSTRICLVNHFQGRVSCPLGQPGVDVAGSPRKSCNADGSGCDAAKGEKCLESATLAPDCDPKDKNSCAGVTGTHCDEKKKICVCTSGGTTPPGFFCGKDSILKNFVCHIPGTDNPVEAPVCGQCSKAKNRNAEQAVYCSCRCGVAEGEPDDPDFN